MGEFGAFVSESFRGTPGLAPSLDEESLDQRVAAIDRRSRMTTRLTWTGIGVMGIVAVVMLLLLLTSDSDTSTRDLVLYASLFVWSGVAIAMTKLWHFQSMTESTLLKEVLRTQNLLLSGLRDSGRPSA